MVFRALKSGSISQLGAKADAVGLRRLPHLGRLVQGKSGERAGIGMSSESQRLDVRI